MAYVELVDRQIVELADDAELVEEASEATE